MGMSTRPKNPCFLLGFEIKGQVFDSVHLVAILLLKLAKMKKIFLGADYVESVIYVGF